LTAALRRHCGCVDGIKTAWNTIGEVYGSFNLLIESVGAVDAVGEATGGIYAVVVGDLVFLHAKDFGQS